MKEDKSEAYWRLTNHYRVSGDLDRAKKLYKEWESTGQVTNQVMSQAFDILKMSLFDTAMSKDERKVLENGPFSYRFKMDNLDSLIKSKQYAKAFALIDPKHLEGEMVSTIIRYDLLGSLVLGKAYKNISQKSFLEGYQWKCSNIFNGFVSIKDSDPTYGNEELKKWQRQVRTFKADLQLKFNGKEAFRTEQNNSF